MMSLIDKLLERRARAAAQTASRRGMLKSLGGVLVGATAVPLLPVARAEGGTPRPVEEGAIQTVTTGGTVQSMAFCVAVVGAAPILALRVPRCRP